MNLCFIWVLFFVLLGSYIYEFTRLLHPCSLCVLQKLGMMGVVTALLMNCRFGIKAQHYGLAILSALLGRIFSLRQIAMHLCPEFPDAGEAVLGLDLYVWAFLVFTLSIFSCAVLTIFYGYTRKKEFPITWNRPEKWTFGAIAVIVLANFITIFVEFGLFSL